MGNKKEPKTYNHYVPQFYLKNFSGNNSIGVYNFDRKKFVNEAAIRKNGGRDFLYGKDNDLEDWFINLEGEWARIINDIFVYEKVPKDSTDYTYLLMFVYLSDVRVAEKADDFKRNKLEESKSIAKILAAQNKISLSESDIESLDVIIDRPNLSYIQGMKNLIPIISELCPMIIINESKLGFITSDVPLAKYNQWFIERDYKHPYGFGHMGFQCFIPLSPKICFCLYDDNVYKNEYSNKGRIRIHNESMVEQLNKLFIQNSYKEVYYQIDTRAWLEKNVVIKSENKSEEWIMGNSQQGYLQKVSSRSVYDIIKLPMFKTNQFYKTAPLPYDEAGPIRKEAFEKMSKWNEAHL